MLKQTILNEVKPEWKIMWESILDDSNIINFLENKYKEYENSDKRIFPNRENILETFKYFDLQDTKVVFLGQDPYINSILENDIEIPQATGLAFSVPLNFTTKIGLHRDVIFSLRLHSPSTRLHSRCLWSIRVVDR